MKQRRACAPRLLSFAIFRADSIKQRFSSPSVPPQSTQDSVAYTLFEAPLAPLMLWKLLPVGLSYVLLQVTLRFKDDSDLAKRLQDRDPRAMSELYDRYGRLAYSLIYRVVRNTGAAEDLVQETFLRVWNRVQSFDRTRGALGPWVLTVARNRAIDYLRSMDGKMSAGALELDRLETPAMFANFHDSAL